VKRSEMPTQLDVSGRSARELNSSDERLLTPKETANFLRVSESWLAKARIRGDGPPFLKIGRSIRYRQGDLIRWMRSRTHLSTSESE
jgi:predicted DNA-binding transcriptional regulator AlpA